MKRILVLSSVLAVFLFVSCDNANKNEPIITADKSEVVSPDPIIILNAKDSLDWKGTYEGVLPCLGCPGLKTSLIVSEDLTYQVHQFYLEDGPEVTSHGKFEWNEEGNIIHLKDVNKLEFLFRVEDNQLRMLNSKGKAVKGEKASLYILNKK